MLFSNELARLSKRKFLQQFCRFGIAETVRFLILFIVITNVQKLNEAREKARAGFSLSNNNFRRKGATIDA